MESTQEQVVLEEQIAELLFKFDTEGDCNKLGNMVLYGEPCPSWNYIKKRCLAQASQAYYERAELIVRLMYATRKS